MSSNPSQRVTHWAWGALSSTLMSRVGVPALLVTVLGLGCGQSAEPTPAPTGCGPSETVDGEGNCVPIGVAPDGCAEGFEHDGGYGCRPIVPAEPCPPGRLAVPGDELCRPVMDCGSGRWGNLPIDGATIYVDREYTGGASDGSETRPFITIGDAVTSAPAGALVAVAGGSYPEDVTIAGASLRLWGRCPDMVEIVGQGTEIAAVTVRTGADGTEVGGLALRGPALGLGLSGSQSVTVAQVWIHHTEDTGVTIENTLGATSGRLVASLIEESHELGVDVKGAEVEIDRSVIRDVQPRASDLRHGRGVQVVPDCSPGDCDPSGAPTLVVRGSLFERNHEVQLVAVGADLLVQGTVVRDALPSAADQTLGRSLSLQPCPTAAGCQPVMRTHATITGSLVERQQEVGIFAGGADLTLEDTVLRHTRSQALDGMRGRGLAAQPCSLAEGCESYEAAQVTIRRSLFEHNQEVGIFVAGSHGDVERTMVRHTTVDGHDFSGDGLVSLNYHDSATLTVRLTVVDESARAGIGVFGSNLLVSDTRIGCAAFPLAAETFEGEPPALADQGNNRCGCPTPDGPCQAVSSGVVPPAPLGM